MTISERLKAIREAISNSLWIVGESVHHVLDEEKHKLVVDHLTAIQASIDSAETDAGKLLQNLRDDIYRYPSRAGGDISIVGFSGNANNFITTALLSQREKYDSLIAKAEVDGKTLAARLKEKLFNEWASNSNNMKFFWDAELVSTEITAALLKAGQREWLPIDEKAKDGNYYIITDGVSVKIGYMKCWEGRNGIEYTDWHDDSNDEKLQITPTHYKHLNPPSSQEGVG